MPQQQGGQKHQQGGLPLNAMVQGTERTLKNGAQAAYFMIDGKKVFRIYDSTREAAQKAVAARKNPRQITAAQAQQAFDKFYARTRTIKRGPRKGEPLFKSPRGRRAARTYDLNHRGKKVVSDARYLHNPHAYEFQGVDTGAKVRKAASPKQAAALEKGRAALKAKRQVGGYWW